jgi:hypothetical protein
MLASIAVLAVVGGALAFKAKTFIADFYCTPNTFFGWPNLPSTSTFDPFVVGVE